MNSVVTPSADRFRRRRWSWWLQIGVALIGLVLASAPATADVPVTLFASFAGNLDFVSTGASFRTQSDNGDSCAVSGSAARSLPGLPPGASIRAAYLYYGASADTLGFADSNVTLTINGSSQFLTADRTFTSRFVNGGNDFDFFGGFEDVTGLIPASTGSTSLSLSGLDIHTGGPHCASQAVFGAWSLVVIIEEPGEPFRVLNVFDGFQQFRGQTITLSPTNFTIPPSPVDGKQLVVTFEGDVGNSAPLNGQSEEIRFNGVVLPAPGDPLGGFNPSNNQFNSTINSLGVSNSYGLDVDTYDVSSLLSPGDTSASTVYSSGGDLVFLTAEVISVTNTPVADLAIDKSHSGDFVLGQNGTFTLSVTNNGPLDDPGPIVVTDALPAGLDYLSASGAGWSCSESSGTVTCSRASGLTAGSTAPAISLQVDVGGAASPSVTNTASVSGADFDNISGNDQDSDTVTVLAPDLSTSTKSVEDLNAGDAEPGDTLRYTITLVESAGLAASNLELTDDLEPDLGSLSVVSVPAGATDVSDPLGGVNGTGRVRVTGIDLAAGGTAQVVFDAVIDGGAQAGDTIDNRADIAGPGIAETVDAPTRIVRASAVPNAGNKPLYLNTADGLQRNLPTVNAPAGTFVEIGGGGDSNTWTLTPPLAADLTIDDVAFPLTLYLSASGSTGGFFGRYREVRVDLVADSGVLATDSFITFSLETDASKPDAIPFEFQLGSVTTIPAGQTLRLEVTNESFGGTRDVRVHPRSADFAPGDFDGRSRVVLPALNVINVDSVLAYDAAWPGGATGTVFSPGDTTYLRAVVSDPFGAFDITAARVQVANADGTGVLAPTAMPPVLPSAVSGSPTRIYEYAYVPTSIGPEGNWTVRVEADEGTEGEISDAGTGTFELGLPDFVILKSSTVVSDPVNGTSNPKRIPGSVINYRIQVSNQGRGRSDPGTVTISDALPAGVVLKADNGSGDALSFGDGSTSSALTFDFATDAAFSEEPDGGPPFTATPADPDNDGFYDNVTGFRVTPSGRMAGNVSGPPAPSFRVDYRVRLD